MNFVFITPWVIENSLRQQVDKFWPKKSISLNRYSTGHITTISPIHAIGRCLHIDSHLFVTVLSKWAETKYIRTERRHTISLHNTQRLYMHIHAQPHTGYINGENRKIFVDACVTIILEKKPNEWRYKVGHTEFWVTEIKKNIDELTGIVMKSTHQFENVCMNLFR